MKNAMKTRMRFASLIAVVLIAAMVLTACGGKTEEPTNTGMKYYSYTDERPAQSHYAQGPLV